MPWRARSARLLSSTAPPCRAHAVAALSLDRMVDRYEDLYRELVDRRLAA